MKAISLWQPWATAIALGLKTNETRSWATAYRGPLAIHASKKESADCKEVFEQLMTRGDFYQPIHNANLFSWSMLPKGAIVCVCNLSEVVPTEVMLECKLAGDRSGLERLLGDYSPGRFAWRLDAVVPLEQPLYMNGHQGLFNVPDTILELV